MNRKTQLQIAEICCGCGSIAAVISAISAFATFMFKTAGTQAAAETNGAYGWWWCRWTTGITIGCGIGLVLAVITLGVVRLLEGKKETVEPSLQNSCSAVIDGIAAVGAIPTILTVFWWMMYL